EPWIFVDQLAVGLSGCTDNASVLAALEAFQDEIARTATPDLAQEWIRGGRLTTAVRARYAEDELEQAIRRGVRQYVILGAGYDSSAYCRRDSRNGPRVFEVDHPDTQRAKVARLRELSVDIPPAVVFVQADFDRQSIFDALEGAGYRRDEPAFFAWLGGIMY